jgi:hypothetical protein
MQSVQARVEAVARVSEATLGNDRLRKPLPDVALTRSSGLRAVHLIQARSPDGAQATPGNDRLRKPLPDVALTRSSGLRPSSCLEEWRQAPRSRPSFEGSLRSHRRRA